MLLKREVLLNHRRRHGSIKYMAPNKFYEAFMSNSVKLKEFSA
jgi:putative transposase